MTDLERMARTETYLEKRASSGNLLLGGLATAAAGTLGALIIDAIKKRKLSKTLAASREAAWKKLVEVYPEFANDPAKNRANFDALFSMSPQVGSIPQYLAPLMRQATEYGTEGLPIEIADKLQNIDTNAMKALSYRSNLPSMGNIATQAAQTAIKSGIETLPESGR